MKHLVKHSVAEHRIVDKIYIIRGEKVMLDRDLALLYGVETRILVQAVKRNADRFPEDFMFQLTKEELENWKSQIVISNRERMGLRKLPFAFTEQGVAMLSSVLRSKRAIRVNIQIMRVYTKMRKFLATHKDMLLKLEQLERKTDSHDEKIKLIFEYIKQLIVQKSKPRKRIGFRIGREK